MKSDAYMDGWHAQRLGAKRNFNPYNMEKQYCSWGQWDNGWGARYDAVKHGLSLELDEEQL